MPQFYTVPTAIGEAKIANAIALGDTINITQLAIGDGGGTLPTPDSDRTALVNEVRRGAINTSHVDDDNPNWIVVEQVLPPDVGGWTIREVGIFDEDDDLIAYGNYPETYKPVLSEGSGRTQTIRFVMQVSSTAAITLKVDPSVVLATRAYVDDQRAEHEESRNHPAANETEQGMARLASQLETDGGENDSAFISPLKLQGKTASAAEAQALASLSRLLTPGRLNDALKGENQALSFKGYQVLPGGLVLQWATESAKTAGDIISFPIEFPAACLTVVTGGRMAATTSTRTIGVNPNTISKNSFEVEIRDENGARSGNGNFYYIAIGY
ncbi:phage tail protein [Vreelandella sp. H-I2]